MSIFEIFWVKSKIKNTSIHVRKRAEHESLRYDSHLEMILQITFFGLHEHWQRHILFFQLLTVVASFLCYPLSIFLCFFLFFCLLFFQRFFFHSDYKQKNTKKNNPMMRLLLPKKVPSICWICSRDCCFFFLTKMSPSSWNFGALIRQMKMIPICTEFVLLFMIIASGKKREQEKKQAKINQ